ncbi:MAG: Asp23/Gls24 family envelope stress response protein [Eubacterium sp.]|jgi:uncharacterized alkaline shock family protein YloU|nr:Asp23/Gls24 family envelope stress response protein [Eubacterium sp.]
MIAIKNHLGEIKLSDRFFVELIGGAVVSCFGVTGMSAGGIKQSVVELFPFINNIRFFGGGVKVKIFRDKLYIGLHIKVAYGANLSSIVKSIQSKVSYVVEEETSLPVERITVYIDGIKG